MTIVNSHGEANVATLAIWMVKDFHHPPQGDIPILVSSLLI